MVDGTAESGRGEMGDSERELFERRLHRVLNVVLDDEIWNGVGDVTERVESAKGVSDVFQGVQKEQVVELVQSELRECVEGDRIQSGMGESQNQKKVALKCDG